MIIGTAWLVRRVRRRTGSHPTSSARPYLLVLVGGRGPCRLRLSLVAHSRGGCCRVFFAANPGLGVGRGRPSGPHGQPMAPTFASACRSRRMGRSGGDPAGLHPVGRGHALSGYCGALARAQHGTGDRCGLCRTCSGSRTRPSIAADASRRASVVLVVSVALAVGTAGQTARVGRQFGRGPHLRRAGSAHTAPHREARCDSPRPCAGRRPAALHSVVPSPRQRWLCRRGGAGFGARPGRTRAGGSSTRDHCSRLCPRAATSTRTTRRCSTHLLRCRPR